MADSNNRGDFLTDKNKRFDLLAKALGITEVTLRDGGKIDVRMVEEINGAWRGQAFAFDEHFTSGPDAVTFRQQVTGMIGLAQAKMAQYHDKAK